MKKPTVILDIDGVLADFVWGFTCLSKQLCGLPEQPYGNGGQFDWNFRVGTGMTGKQINAVWEHIKQSPNYWYSLPLLASASEIELLRNLSRDGLSIHYLTGRLGLEAEGQTENWLADWRFPLDRNSLTVLGGGSKAEYLGQYADYYERKQTLARILEDKPAEVRALYGNGWPVYVRDWPYNREVRIGGRVSSLAEFLCSVMRED